MKQTLDYARPAPRSFPLWAKWLIVLSVLLVLVFGILFLNHVFWEGMYSK